jgi:hypothetical protein
LNIGGDIVSDFYVKSKPILLGNAYEFNAILIPNYPVFAGIFFDDWMSFLCFLDECK